MMSLTGKLFGAAVIGAGATYLMRGDYSRRAKGQAAASGVLGWAIAVLIVHLFPQFANASIEVNMGLVALCCSLVGYVYSRMDGLTISVKLPGGGEISSKGKENADKQPD